MSFEICLLILGLLGASYSYFIYPIILSLLPKKQRTLPEGEPSSKPSVTFIITAFNEERHIADKLKNTLEVVSDYPSVEILVASDGSTDRTNLIVNDFSNQGVKLVEVTEQKGKENAQHQAILVAEGEILVFSDVSTRIEKNALDIIVAQFKSPQIGAISSEDRFLTSDGKVAGEGAYVKYEMWLRNLEGQVNTLVGLSGSFFAARKTVCKTWDITIPSDFNTALNCARQGLIAVSVPSLLGFYPNLKDETKEYQRKVRTVIRGIAALFARPDVLNISKFGLFSFQIISHKLMRWTVPWFLIISFLSNLLLLGQNILFDLLMAGQVAFYLTALIGWKSEVARKFSVIKIPYFFLQVNIAIAHATIQYISGKRVTKWTPSKR